MGRERADSTQRGLGLELNPQPSGREVTALHHRAAPFKKILLQIEPRQKKTCLTTCKTTSCAFEFKCVIVYILASFQAMSVGMPQGSLPPLV